MEVIVWGAIIWRVIIRGTIIQASIVRVAILLEAIVWGAIIGGHLSWGAIFRWAVVLEPPKQIKVTSHKIFHSSFYCVVLLFMKL